MALNEGRSPDAANDFLCKVASNGRCWINRGGFALDGKTHMTGAQIRALPMPSIRDTDDLYMEVPGSEDVLVQYDEVVPVAGRRFFSVPSTINAGSPDAANLREIAVGGDGKTPILDSVTGEPIRVPYEPRSAATEQEFKDCLRLRELADRQTLTVRDNRDLAAIADRLHALAVSSIETRYEEES